MITFDEKIDFFNTVGMKTPIITVTEKQSEDRVDFFMAKGDDVQLLLSRDLRKLKITPRANETYFIVKQIHTKKAYNVFKLDKRLFECAIGR